MRMLTCLLLLIGLSASALAEERRYTVLLMDHPAGTQVVTGEGADRRITFEYSDRGRGPKTETRLHLLPDGTTGQLITTGHDYLKQPIDEKFTVAAGRARWSNGAEQGEHAAGSSFYLGMYSPPEELGVLAAALLAGPGGALALLPAGEARIEKVGTLEVAAQGRKQTVMLYGIHGLGLVPVPVWLDGERRLFAAGSSWQMVVRSGWEATADMLVKAQEAAEVKRTEQVARQLAQRPAGPVALRDVTLFDARQARPLPRQTVIVRGARIEAVGPAAQLVPPPGALVIDGKGKTLLPGLWDMHTHSGDGTDGAMYLAAGVTTIRDLGNDIDLLARLQAREGSGVAIGPRILKAGFIDSRGPFAGPTKIFADTPEEARAAVARYAQLGYVQIKIYSSVHKELVPVIVAEAHRRGLRVSGHVPWELTAADAVRAGFDEIQHANFLVLNFLADKVKDTRGPVRFTAVAEEAAGLDLSSRRVQDFIALLKSHGTVIDPTLNIFESMFTNRLGQVGSGWTAVADRLPPQVRRGLLSGGLPVPPGKDQRYRDSFRALLQLVAAMYRAGVTEVAGTDDAAGFSLQRELELYVEAGIPAAEVLRLATLGAARVMKRDGDLGTVEGGKLADLVLIDGDPVAHIKDVRRVSLVMKDGVMYDPAAIDRAYNIRPW